MSAAHDRDRCRVLIVHDRAQRYLAALRDRFPSVQFTVCSRPEALDTALHQARAEVVFSLKNAAIPGPCHRAALLAPSTRWVQVAGSGFDHLQPVTRDDVVITNGSGVLSEFMAETVLGAMLMLNFGFHTYVHQQRERRWQMNPWRGLSGKTALVIGLGEIGRRVAAHAKHLGMRTLGVRSRPEPVPGIDELIPRAELHRALARADVICVHVPLVDTTRGLLDRSAFAQMKRGTMLINTARGGVMDELALVEALADGTVAAAHVDVFEQEPLPADSPLWALENLVITPHVADSVIDWEARFAAFFADNLERWLARAPLRNVVDPGRGY